MRCSHAPLGSLAPVLLAAVLTVAAATPVRHVAGDAPPASAGGRGGLQNGRHGGGGGIALDAIVELAGEHVCEGFDEEWGQCPNLPSCNKCTPVDCRFGSWGNWYTEGGCTGLRFRHRSVRVQNNECGKPCAGPKIMSERHILDRCKVHEKDCAFAGWSEWTTCTSEHDQAMRSRMIKQPPSEGGAPCNGGLKETKACGSGPKPMDCEFAAWREWTTCSATCGEGRHTRMRRIAHEARHEGMTCEDRILETKSCNVGSCPNRCCKLAAWSEWTLCDATRSQRYRHRDILTAPLNGGTPCPPNLVETEGCPTPVPVDCDLTEWTQWSECDQTCGGGQTFRQRQLSTPNADGGKCDKHVLKETTVCNTGPCWTTKPDDCVLAGWSEWSECSAKCGKGSTTRTRKVATLASSRGKGCEGPLEEVTSCLVHHCNIADCVWSEWYEWSACSTSCGGGSKRRSRAVAVSPLNGGQLCQPNDMSEVSPCNAQSCDHGCVDGLWGVWMEWSGCSASCSSGFKSRRRDVEVEPNACGKPVSGLREEFVVCSELQPCVQDRDCELGSWGEWSHCSCHCFGIRERNRYIAVFAAGQGKPCANEPLKVIEPCNPKPGQLVSPECGNKPAVDCELAHWGQWSKCTAPCGGGQMERKRSILAPPSNGGKACENRLIVTVPCNTQRCQPRHCVDCQWGQWSEWGDCSKCGGQRFRHRSIEKLPNHCGRRCDAKCAKETTNCTSHCQKTMFCAWTEWSDSTRCNTGCGSSTTMRNRIMTLTKPNPGTDFIFKGTDDSKCAGTQLNVSLCPVTKSCTPKCTPRHCRFGSWSDWQEPTCVGLCERQRAILELNNECGDPCNGYLLETKKCPVSCQLKKDCTLAQWQEWTACQSDAQSTQKYRFREIEQKPENGGSPCAGILHETAPCTQVLPEPCQFTEWGSWTGCSKTCGCGWHTRLRSIASAAKHGGVQCKGTLKQLGRCHRDSPGCFNKTKVDCELSAWTAWTSCGSDGQRFRDRRVTRLAANDGASCKGSLRETEICNDLAIDCSISEWTRWDICDRTCGGGQTHRQRQIHRFPEHGGKACPHELIQTKGCNINPCDRQDCHVGSWTEWDLCTATCGVGVQERRRAVASLRSAGGNGCDFALGEVRDCRDNPRCDTVDCAWGEWSDWGGCTCSCDGGQRTRSRHVMRKPSPGGKPCSPHAKDEIEPCNTQKCGVEKCRDGEFSEWGEWERCTVSCGGGVSSRHRKIARMANACGKEPKGKNSEVRFCSVNVPCEKPVDCRLTEWGTWSDCSATCNGIKRRSRRVGRYGRGDGEWCIGALKETWPCNPGPGQHAPGGCSEGRPVDCALGEWNRWTECSASCGGGEHTRSRDIIRHPEKGGKPCESALSEVRECARRNCHGPPPMDCEYGEWEEWGACSKCSGQRERIRRIKQYPEHGGKACRPTDLEETGSCPRKCHAKQYCTWAEWESWTRCSATCGTGGKRHRRRSLQLTDDPAAFPPAPVEDLMDKYDALFQRTKDLEGHHYEELLVAFGAGCASLVAVIVGFRTISSVRRAPEAGISRTLSVTHELPLATRASAARYHHLRELNETELPLIGADVTVRDGMAGDSDAIE